MTNVNIVGALQDITFDVQCGNENCDFTGSITYQGPKISTLSVGGQVTFTGAECPSCGGDGIFAPSGRYERDPETGKMNRVGDFEP